MSTSLIKDLQQQMQAMNAQGLLRRRRTTASACDVHVDVDGRPMLSFNSNDYLGLASNARVVEALREGASLYGAGSGASHLISGHSKAHAQLEDKLSALFSPHLEQPRALHFSTGYMANLALLGALASPAPHETEIFSDALNHASLIDGARLSRAQVTVYPHADLEALGQALKNSKAKIKLVVTDGVFSMDGDIAPLPELLALCEQHGAWMVVDDAHGFGVLGEHGRGVLEHFALRSPQLIYMGTLGKAAGVSGAFVTAHQTVIEWLVQRARPYIYTTASPPALAHALLTSIDFLTGEEGCVRRAHLVDLRLQLTGLSVKPGWQQLDSVTPIQPLVIGSNEDVLNLADALWAQGLWVSAIRAPTVPVGTARLRITLSASHSLADVARLKAALAQVT
jgi:8-amino-7-oxononanoate synthase